MAEAEQPQKGSTAKFSDTAGKMDALVFAALGINLQAFLSALGITSLKDLKNFNLANINLDLLLSLLMSLSHMDLNRLLSFLNLSSLNLRSLLSILGLPSSVITLLDIIQGAFSQGGGIFTGGTEIPGINNSFTPSTGWLPGDSEDLLDINNPPQTGWQGNTPDDPTNPEYIPPGSENAGNVLAGVTNPAEIIDKVLPQGGINEFYFDSNIDTAVRFDVSKFVPWSEIGGMDYLRGWLINQLGYLPPMGDYKITAEEGRIDMLSQKIYGDTQYWWILMQYNGIIDMNDLKTGAVLQFPSLEDLEDLYFRVKSLGESSGNQ